jgi:hypothetical protein
LDFLEKTLKVILSDFLPSQSGNEGVSKGEDFWSEVISSMAIPLDESQFHQGVTKPGCSGVVSPQSLGNFRKGESVACFGKGLKDG